MQFLSRGLIGIGMAVTGFGACFNSIVYTVEPGYRAVMFDRFKGIKDIVIDEGAHFKIPYVHMPIMYDTRLTPNNLQSVTGSKDLQNVSISLRVLYRPSIPELPKIYESLGIDYADKVLPSVTNEVLKAVVAQFDASELITQREIVSNQVAKELTERAKSFGIILDDIAITHLAFGREFAHSVEAKQVAQQEAERARYLVEKAEQLKLAAIISAEGDAKAADMISEALQRSGDAMVEMRRIDAAEEIATKLSNSRKVVYLPDKQNALLQLPGPN